MIEEPTSNIKKIVRPNLLAVFSVASGFYVFMIFMIEISIISKKRLTLNF